jgi:hypothetical protein
MSKQAERPLTASFIEGSSCTFDSNDFVEWESEPNQNDKSGYISDIVFMGYPYTFGGRLTELGRVSIFHIEPLEIHHDIINLVYEAQHPWLDLNDALEKGCLEIYKDYETIEASGGDYDYSIHMCEENKLPISWTAFKSKDSYLPHDVLAFRPLASDKQAWVDCASVKVWQPPENVL